MSSSPVPHNETKRNYRPGVLRPWLVGLCLLSVVATAERVVGLSAPMPTTEAPSMLRLADYRVAALVGEPSQQGREMSRGRLRRFRLEPLSGGSLLTLSLLPVRSRTGTELSEGSKERKGLNLLAVGAQVPGFALSERRLLSLPKPQGVDFGSQGDQIALGRRTTDPKGTITRLQTCLTPSGHAGVSASTLVGQGQIQGDLSVLERRVLLLAGVVLSHHECLAAQLERDAPGEKPLIAAWQDVKRVLVGQ